MGKLGKILAPIAAVLAIALAGLSFLIYDGSLKYQKRAANLAETVEKTAKKLDAGTNSGLVSGISYTAPAPGVKESGKLSFKDYRTDPSSFEKNTGNVVKLAGDVIAQRDELSEAIAEMTKALGIQSDVVTAEQLDTLEGYKELLTIAKSYAEAFRKKDNELAKAIQDAAKLVGASNAANASKRLPTIKESKVASSGGEGEEGEASTVKTAVYDSQAKNLAQLSSNIEALQKRRAAYEAAIKNITKVMSAHKFTAKVNGISGSGFEKILLDLATDMKAINDKLKELAKVKKELQQEKAKVEEAQKQINKLKAEKAELDTKLKEAIQKMEYYGILGNTQKPDLTDKSQVNPDTRGKVIIDNSKWNYVVANLGKKQVVPDVEVIISNNGTYLGSGKITKVEEEICLIEMSMRKTAEIPKDSTVIISEPQEGAKEKE